MHNKIKMWGGASLALLLLFATGPVLFSGGPGGLKSSTGADTNATGSEQKH